MQTPESNYRHQLAQGTHRFDPQQAAVVAKFQLLYEQYVCLNKRPRWRQWLKAQPLPKGLYLWGGVGIGKTWLMDTFYNCLPKEGKQRMHFHRFMHHVHSELKALQGQRNPLQLLAKRLAKTTRILCFDEFFVKDIADAMILGNLLTALFAEGIILVATSNVAIEDLYRNGLQRELFLPAIAQLQQHTEEIHLTISTDYRLRHLDYLHVYFTPLTAENEQAFAALFYQMNSAKVISFEPIEIAQRLIPVRAAAAEQIWFDFEIICNEPRSQNDYLAIANRYHTVFISGVPDLTVQGDKKACYLINLVDVFYDSRIKLVLSAACSVDELYPQGRFSFEFQRTRSRLKEMQSKDYVEAG